MRQAQLEGAQQFSDVTAISNRKLDSPHHPPGDTMMASWRPSGVCRTTILYIHVFGNDLTHHQPRRFHSVFKRQTGYL